MYNLAIQNSQELLDDEILGFDHNPADYVSSMAWSKELQNKCKKLSGKIILDSDDYMKLAKIIDGILTNNPETTTIEIAENNDVNDYLVNCIADKINKLLKL